ncbi:hypothetical protein OHV05_06415 [Kitasatospora sp. NBC_00070]|uniref:peptidoglycan-binding domain-containing protein n=1 Tax=Kitasatospora sp. NBC_00070 TaxID=2975962 RepID=UPI003249D95C
MLRSELFSGTPDLAQVAAGARKIQAPESSASVATVQQALVTVGGALPTFGVDGRFGAETGAAVGTFKADRGLRPSDPVVGPGTVGRLDLELTFLDGTDTPSVLADPALPAREPFTASVLDVVHPDLDITGKVLQLLELGDEFCFSMSMAILDAPKLASFVGRFVEPHINADFCARNGPCSPVDDFFDTLNSPAPYTAFLLAHNPAVPPAVVAQIGASVRPDILSHRPGRPAEWYEIKPLSPSGVTEGIAKGVKLRSNYENNGFPYRPGKTYTPSPTIPLMRFITPEGEHLELVIEARRLLPGLLFYRLCIRGDYVRFFNRVRLAAGILAVLAALAPELAAAGAVAEEVAAFVALVQSIAEGLGVLLPALTAL